MGVGKTTVGKQLAKQIGFDFLDTDQELEQRTGVTVAHIFELEGEHGFRTRETRLIDEIAARKGSVVATGGGAVLNEANRHAMKQSGLVVYLTASAEQLWERIKHSKSRPLLQTDDPYGALKRIVQERDLVYLRLADHVIKISATSEATAKRVAERLKLQDKT